MSCLVLIGYFGWSYYITEYEATKKENSKISYIPESSQVREIGYIQDFRITRSLIKHEKEIIWWVKIPSTNKLYSCSWEGGFADYEKDEGVELIHLPGGTDSEVWDGYIIGLHGNHKGKLTLVCALDVDDILYDINED